MNVRRNIMPRTILDFTCFSFVLLVIPIVYWFELFVVLPTFYSTSSAWYILHFLTGNFVALNVVTNLVATVLVDTSVKGRIMPTEMKPGWRFCSVCESIVPPRSWHCDTCKTCILKRDHHCVFSACCVGHENCRYFLMFGIYMFLATVYSTYFNSFFIWQYVDFSDALTWLKMVFPLAMLMYEITMSQLYLFLYLLVVFGFVFTAVLLWFHITLMLSGQITHERNFNIPGYDYGLVKNIEMIFGERWYLTWASPFVRSKLPHDGMNWEPRETLKTK